MNIDPPDTAALEPLRPADEITSIQSVAAKGGRARANSLTPEHRKEIARAAVRARWVKSGKVKEYEEKLDGNDDSGPAVQTVATKPFSMFRGTIKIGNTEYECHVLDDERRVFTQREIVRAISGGRESGNLQRYLDRNPLTADGYSLNQIEFDVPGSRQTALGAEATELIDLCEKYLEADDQGKLKGSQKKLAVQCGIIIRASAKVGIVALVDEGTGYQAVRKKNDLQIKFQAFVADELQEWARMFPEEFWVELARLEGIKYSPRYRPIRWGKYIMMFVYDAVDPDIGKMLREKNPNPRFLRNHHQWLKKFGREKVNNQIQRVITVMHLCRDMDDFRAKFSHVFKKSPLQISFDDVNWTSSPGK